MAKSGSRPSKTHLAKRFVSNQIVLTPDQQLAFWEALNKPVRLTKAQRRLGAIMRGES